MELELILLIPAIAIIFVIFNLLHKYTLVYSIIISTVIFGINFHLKNNSENPILDGMVYGWINAFTIISYIIVIISTIAVFYKRKLEMRISILIIGINVLIAILNIYLFGMYNYEYEVKSCCSSEYAESKKMLTNKYSVSDIDNELDLTNLKIWNEDRVHIKYGIADSKDSIIGKNNYLMISFQNDTDSKYVLHCKSGRYYEEFEKLWYCINGDETYRLYNNIMIREEDTLILRIENIETKQFYYINAYKSI